MEDTRKEKYYAIEIVNETLVFLLCMLQSKILIQVILQQLAHCVKDNEGLLLLNKSAVDAILEEEKLRIALIVFKWKAIPKHYQEWLCKRFNKR